jgi:hypothetical protein
MKTLLLPYFFLEITTATDLNMISYLFIYFSAYLPTLILVLLELSIL